MKLANHAPNQLPRTIIAAAIVSIILILGSSTRAQSPQLSLADILIGLRSKKVSLPERNTILTEAVRQRGVTFAMTAEIEKELGTTGASPSLVDAIRQKIAASKPAPPVVKPVAAVPVPTPTPPDFSFYQTRADQNAGKGEFGQALADYNKSLEMKSDNAIAYLGRGKAHFNLKSYDLSVKDFDRALELNPRDSVAFLNRGVSFEKLGEARKAMADYQKAADLDPANEVAKSNLKRLEDAAAAAAAAEAAKNVPPPPPEFISLGVLSAANAVRMVTPTYSVIAQRSQVEGKVVVELELNDAGDVVLAKASSGPQMLRSAAEDAARKSKFKPAMYNNRPIKAKAQIIYNFSLKDPR
ncbi:MAG TPA: TonB family protein [Pyrinomonadaceae bacterium]|nr:TonB family protein [Pyrinomonadaceae bacterium]